MQYNRKISKYKIKKILKCFTEDYTATNAATHLKLNRNTINRYYHIFREICVANILKSAPTELNEENYIGIIRKAQESQSYFKIYKIDEKNFLYKKTEEMPNGRKYAIQDKDFRTFVSFLYQRLTKFRKKTGKGHYQQFFESLFRYNNTPQALSDMLLKQLPITSKNITEINRQLLAIKYGTDLKIDKYTGNLIK